MYKINMKKTAKKIVKSIMALLILSNLHVSAQKNPNEVSVFGGGGASFFIYQTPMNKTFSIGYNCDIGIGFTGFVSQQCGFHLGAGFGMFNVRANAGDLYTFTPEQTDIHGYPYELHTTLYDYREIHKTKFIEFPLMFQFQTKQLQTRNWKKGFYAMTGLKLLVLFNRTYDSQISVFYNAAYYPEFDNWTATQKFVGLGKFDGKDANGKPVIGVLATYTFESGIKWRLGKNLFLYSGIYFDCGLNDPTKKIRQPVNNYITVKSLENFSILRFYDKSFLIGTGIKLRLAYYKISKIMPCPYTY
jgi:hypothetical protein